MDGHLTVNNRFFKLARQISFGWGYHMYVSANVVCHAFGNWTFVKILAFC